MLLSKTESIEEKLEEIEIMTDNVFGKLKHDLFLISADLETFLSDEDLEDRTIGNVKMDM